MRPSAAGAVGPLSLAVRGAVVSQEVKGRGGESAGGLPWGLSHCRPRALGGKGGKRERVKFDDRSCV